MCGIKMIFNNNKKAIVFTLLAILLSTMFVLILTGGVTYRVDNKLELTRARGAMVESYYESFIAYSEYALEISAKSCLSSLSEYLVDHPPSYYTDNTSFFNDVVGCMENARTNEFSGANLPSSENQTISKLLEQLITLTEEDYGINTDYTILNIVIIPKGPDKLRISAEIAVKINDSSMELSPYVNDLLVDVSFNGALDPYYSQKISNNTIIDIKVIGENDMDLIGLTFEEFLDNVQYIQSSLGYSIIDRFLGVEVSSSEGVIYFINGSESLTKYQSYVDIYATNSSIAFACDELYCLSSACTDEDFRIDQNTFNSMKLRYELDITNWEKTPCS